MTEHEESRIARIEAHVAQIHQILLCAVIGAVVYSAMSLAGLTNVFGWVK